MTTWDELSDPTIGPEQFQQYVYNRTGLYSAVASTVAFLPWSQFMRQDYIEQLKNELDSVLSSDSRYFKSTFALQRRWLEDDTIPQLELILFPRNLHSFCVPYPGLYCIFFQKTLMLALEMLYPARNSTPYLRYLNTRGHGAV